MTCNDYVYFARDGNSLVVMVTQHIYVMYIKAYSKKLHYVPSGPCTPGYGLAPPSPSKCSSASSWRFSVFTELLRTKNILKIN